MAPHRHLPALNIARYDQARTHNRIVIRDMTDRYITLGMAYRADGCPEACADAQVLTSLLEYSHTQLAEITMAALREIAELRHQLAAREVTP